MKIGSDVTANLDLSARIYTGEKLKMAIEKFNTISKTSISEVGKHWLIEEGLNKKP